MFRIATVLEGSRGVGVFVSAYEAGLVAGRGSAAVRVGVDVAGFGPQKANGSIGMIGRAHLPGVTARSQPGLLKNAVDGLLRLILPVTLLLCVGAICAIYSQTPVSELGTFAGHPLSVGLALLPVTLFVIQLTNRRYGAAYAFAQVMLAWGLVVTTLSYSWTYSWSDSWNLLPTPLNMRVDLGFGVGLFLAQVVSVILFDGLRGPSWWTAPLFASLAGGAVLCLVAFPVAFAGTSANWTGEMVSYLELVTVAGVALLVPYALLRSLVPPRPGYGGY